jgi:hypothetical protein
MYETSIISLYDDSHCIETLQEYSSSLIILAKILNNLHSKINVSD